MSNWNSLYTQRKQKEMMDEALADEKKKKKKQQPLKPLYRNVYGNSSFTRKQQQEKHEKFCWRVGFAIMAIITGLFVWFLTTIL